jgi:hypothetical protein
MNVMVRAVVLDLTASAAVAVSAAVVAWIAVAAAAAHKNINAPLLASSVGLHDLFYSR